MPRQHRLRRRAGERRLAGEHLVQHAAEAVEVAPPVDRRVAAGLLGAHVGRRADGEAGLGEPLAAGRASARAIPKSATMRVAVGEQDVLRLDVAVDDALACA